MSKIKRSIALASLLIASQLALHMLIRYPLRLFPEKTVEEPLPLYQQGLPATFDPVEMDSLMLLRLSPSLLFYTSQTEL